MTGTKNSGRKASFREPVEVHFQMEREDVNVLDEIAGKMCKNNRSELILTTMKRLIDKYVSQ